MSRRIALALALWLLPALAFGAGQGQETTHFPVPTASSSFLSDLQTFLLDDDAARFADMSVSMVGSGGTHGTVAGLTGTPAALRAYPDGYYITETGSISYPDASVCWVVATRDTSGNVTTFVRVAGTHYAIDCVSVSQPALPALSAYLMKVTTVAGAITAVVDLRNLSLGKDPWIAPGTLQVGVGSARTGTLSFFNAGSAFAASFRAGANVSAATYTLPTALPLVASSLLTSDTNGTLTWSNPAGVTTSAGVLRFYHRGACVVASSLAKDLVESGGTIAKVWAAVDTAPTGADLILDVKLNGTSIWNLTPANRVRIAAGATSGSQISFDTTSMSAGGVFSFDITQIGSVVAGCSDLMIAIQFS